MAFTVSEFRDLIQLLEQHPAWRAELRRWVLTEELLALPQTVGELAGLQRQTEARIEQLTGRMDALAQHVDTLAQHVDTLAQHVDTLAQHVDTLTQRVDGLAQHVDEQAQRFDHLLIHISDLSQRMDELAQQMAQLTTRMDEQAQRFDRMLIHISDLSQRMEQLAETQLRMGSDLEQLKGHGLEQRYRERAPAYFSRMLRRIHALSNDELDALLDAAVTQGQLSEDEADAVLQTDVVVRGRRREDGTEVYLVVEVSWGVGLHDVQRAAERAALLTRLGTPALPVVAGFWVTPEAQEPARAFRVWQVTDGRVTPPEVAPHS
jgi:chromosome segregation ATPase